MNPSSLFTTDIGTGLALLYLCIVVIVGILGAVNLAVLHKHAERQSVAQGITLVFAVIFILICILSGLTILQFFSNANA